MGNANIPICKRCAPDEESQNFYIFQKMLQNHQELEEYCGMRGRKTTVEARKVQEFILHACRSAILCELIYEDDIEAKLRAMQLLYPAWFNCSAYQISDVSLNTAKVGVFKFAGHTGVDFVSYLVVRGSHAQTDWQDNLDHEPYEFLGEENFVHKGLRSRADLVPLDMIFRKVKAGGGTLVGTGHSQGGAAIGIKSILMRNGIEVFTFGQPCCFYKSFPDHLQPLHKYMRRHIHRFYIPRDPVSTITLKLAKKGEFLEHMLRLEDTNPENCRNLKDALPLPDEASMSDLSKHSMREYTKTLLGLACVQIDSGCKQRAKNSLQEAREVHDFYPEVLSLEPAAWKETDGNRLRLKMIGIGYNTSWTKVNLLDENGSEIPGVTVVDGSIEDRDPTESELAKWNMDKKGSSGRVKDDEDLSAFSVTFDFTDAKLSSTKVAFSATNGFHKLSSFSFGLRLNNVVFVGKPGTGKSHLVRAMGAFASGKEYPDIQDGDVQKSDFTKCEEFTSGKMTFFEYPGISRLHAKDLDDVMKAVGLFPPRAVVFVWRAFDKDQGDFLEVVEYINKLISRLPNPDDVSVFFALTQCALLAKKRRPCKYKKNLDELMEYFGLSNKTEGFLVNAAHDENDKRAIVGVDTLFHAIEKHTNRQVPLKRSIQAGQDFWGAFKELCLYRHKDA